jgi:hypothetical protein
MIGLQATDLFFCDLGAGGLTITSRMTCCPLVLVTTVDGDVIVDDDGLESLLAVRVDNGCWSASNFGCTRFCVKTGVTDLVTGAREYILEPIIAKGWRGWRAGTNLGGTMFRIKVGPVILGFAGASETTFDITGVLDADEVLEVDVEADADTVADADVWRFADVVVSVQTFVYWFWNIITQL